MIDSIREFITYLVEIHGMTYVTPYAIGVWFVFAIYYLIRASHFGYHYYIQTGHVLLITAGGANSDGIEATLNKINIKDIYVVGYLEALLLVSIVFVAAVLFGEAWTIILPVIVILFLLALPVVLIKLLARTRRKKLVFEQRLQGKDTT